MTIIWFTLTPELCSAADEDFTANRVLGIRESKLKRFGCYYLFYARVHKVISIYSVTTFRHNVWNYEPTSEDICSWKSVGADGWKTRIKLSCWTFQFGQLCRIVGSFINISFARRTYSRRKRANKQILLVLKMLKMSRGVSYYQNTTLVSLSIHPSCLNSTSLLSFGPISPPFGFSHLSTLLRMQMAQHCVPCSTFYHPPTEKGGKYEAQNSLQLDFITLELEPFRVGPTTRGDNLHSDASVPLGVLQLSETFSLVSPLRLA